MSLKVNPNNFANIILDPQSQKAPIKRGLAWALSIILGGVSLGTIHIAAAIWRKITKKAPYENKTYEAMKNIFQKIFKKKQLYPNNLENREFSDSPSCLGIVEGQGITLKAPENQHTLKEVNEPSSSLESASTKSVDTAANEFKLNVEEHQQSTATKEVSSEEDKCLNFLAECRREKKDPLDKKEALSSSSVAFRKVLAKELFYEKEQRSLFFKDAENFFSGYGRLHLDQKTTDDLFIEIAHENPLLIYEQHKFLPLSCEARKEIEKIVPFFDIQKKVEDISASLKPFIEIRAELEKVLHQLHELNVKGGIPFDLYKWPGYEFGVVKYEINLATIIYKLAKDCNGEELLELVSLINKNYFCGANGLLRAVLQQAQTKFPQLEELITTHHMDAPSYSLDWQVKSFRPITPFLTLSGVKNIITQKWGKSHRTASLSVPQVTTLDSLSPLLQQFSKSSQKRLSVILRLESSDAEHYTSLIFERKGNSISVLVSDSIYPIHKEFTEMIVEKLHESGLGMTMYIIGDVRQHDMYSCPIFSIRDVAEAAKIMKSEKTGFFGYIQQHAEIVPGSVKEISVQEVKRLPLNMMKMTQSLTKVKEISTKNLSASVHSKKRTMNLQEYVDEQCYFIYDLELKRHIRVNLSAARRGAKYFQKVLENVVHP